MALQSIFVSRFSDKCIVNVAKTKNLNFCLETAGVGNQAALEIGAKNIASSRKDRPRWPRP